MFILSEKSPNHLQAPDLIVFTAETQLAQRDTDFSRPTLIINICFCMPYRIPVSVTVMVTIAVIGDQLNTFHF